MFLGLVSLHAAGQLNVEPARMWRIFRMPNIKIPRTFVLGISDGLTYRFVTLEAKSRSCRIPNGSIVINKFDSGELEPVTRFGLRPCDGPGSQLNHRMR